MFTFENYPKNKLRLFFKYLVHATSKLEQVEHPKRKITWREAEMEERAEERELRLAEITSNRREELEQKIQMFFHFLLPIRFRRVTGSPGGGRGPHPLQRSFWPPSTRKTLD